jgi:anti-sigma factor ChrR (cupin superfamily)
MNLNTDISQRVVLNADALPLIPSPSPQVHRCLLARSGAEDAVATSVVRYEPQAVFQKHAHPQGEEILVLEGEFSDEHGVYPAGTYIKNPHGSSHAPHSASGCTLFVKLRHLAEQDQRRVVVKPSDRCWQPGLVQGLEVLALDEFAGTHTALVHWAAGTRFSRHRHYGGEEIFVLQGMFQDEHGDYPERSWLRSPHLSEHSPFSEQGCLIWVKVGHLLH